MVKAILDRVFIKLERQEKSEGGIILQEDFVKADNIGEVVAIGPQVTSVKNGDKVVFHCFDDLPSHDPNIVVIREKSLLGVFE